MTRENVIAALRNISASYNERGVCRFSGSPIREKALGFVDTSGERNGTRGIVFFDGRAVVNFDGEPLEIPYRKIRETQIISSYEDSFSDELAVRCEDGEIRISDCSLNKAALKILLDELCADCKKSDEKKLQAEQLAAIISDNLAENGLHSNAPTIISEPIPETVYTNTTHQNIEESFSDIVFEDGAPVISEVVSEAGAEYAREQVPAPGLQREALANESPRAAVIEMPAEAPRPEFVVVDNAENEERLKIQNMSREETLVFLAQSLDEINAPAERTETPKADTELRMISDYVAAEPVEEKKSSSLTTEPIWGDIYIKASRNLRELCESGKLSMAQIEKELNSELLDSARAFAEITADKAKVPKVLIPKITELKAAAYSFDQYFLLGEDIAVRAMFFMLYQMLSYADRIAETPETKERLNNFFRRFGPAGITLSMLDMRV